MARRVLEYLCAGIVALFVLAGAAPAPDRDPGSTTNVMPTSAQDLGPRREALFAAMLRDPADLDVAFEYAALSAAAGDLEAAVSTLERMLIFAPGLPRLQFELGVLYYRLGAYETAATYLRSVRDASGVPPEVASQVELYLDAIEERTRTTFFSGSITAGARFQSNANSGLGSPNLTLNGLQFLLSSNALSTPDANAFVAGSMRVSVDLENQGDRFEASFDAYAAMYRILSSSNTGVIEAKAGPVFNLRRIGISNAELSVYGIAGTGILGGAPYLASAGLGSALTVLLDARSRIVVRGEGRYEAYFDSASRPNASQRTGSLWSGTGTYEYRLTPDLTVNVALSVGRRISRVGHLSNWTVGGRVGASLEFGSPVPALTAPWIARVSVGIDRQRGDVPDPVFSSTNVEQTTRLFAEGSLTVPLPNAFALQGSAFYVRSVSNYAFGNFDNLGASLALSKGF